MFADPFVLKVPQLSAHTALTGLESISLARLPEINGVVTYSGASSFGGGYNVSLRNSHSKSNENKGVAPTSRAVSRIDVTGVNSDARALRAFAYTVIGMPEMDMYASAAAIANAEPPLLAIDVFQLLLAATAISSSATTIDETKIARLAAGES